MRDATGAVPRRHSERPVRRSLGEGGSEESIKTKAGFAGLKWLYTKYEVYPEQSRRDYRLIESCRSKIGFQMVSLWLKWENSNDKQ